jgi:hypothetical protein
MWNKARAIFISAIGIIALACAPSIAATPPSPSTGSTENPNVSHPILPGPASWTLEVSTIEHTYLAITGTQLQLTDSAITLRDTLAARTEFRISVSREPRSSSIIATVNSFAVQGGSRTGSIETPPQLPLSAIGHLENNKFTFAPAVVRSPSTSCTNSAVSTLSVIHRSFILVPFELHTGMTWMDSTSAELCNGSIPIIATSVRTFRVLGESLSGTTPVILLEKHEKLHSTGEGSSGQHRVLLNSEGSGIGQIAIDRATGLLVDDASTYTTTVSIRSSGRDQRFTQVVKEHVTRTM